MTTQARPSKTHQKSIKSLKNHKLFIINGLRDFQNLKTI